MNQFCLIIITARNSECDELELSCAKLVTNHSETWRIGKMAGIERCEYNQNYCSINQLISQGGLYPEYGEETFGGSPWLPWPLLY